jgi:pseudaminic acid cytidylyltransferase
MDFDGKPMIAHAISAAKSSGLFQKIVVSTDDNEIAQVARDYGGEIPFVRPQKLADDITPTIPVVRHAITECTSLGYKFEYVCCIYPCVPLIQIKDLELTFKKLEASNADFSFPVAEFPSKIERALNLFENGNVLPVKPAHQSTRTQDLPAAYYDAGLFYWAHKQAWLDKENIHENGVGTVIPDWRVADIDTPDDLKRAEFLYKFLSTNGNL